jgi:hypothetical protein
MNDLLWKFGIDSGSGGLLHAAPAAIPDESPNSWIQRICFAHQYSLSRFKCALHLHTSLMDFDVQLGEADWNRILVAAYAPLTTCAIGRQELINCKQARNPDRLLLGSARAPQYRWCSMCLESDEQPYFRWWWRLSDASFCNDHGCDLSEVCGVCGGGVSLTSALMVVGSARSPVFNLALCQHCGVPLMGPPVDQVKLFSARRGTWGTQRFLVDEPSERISGSGDGVRRPTLQITASNFTPSLQSSGRAGRGRKKWSQSIPRYRKAERSKLAYALCLIRRELRT